MFLVVAFRGVAGRVLALYFFWDVAVCGMPGCRASRRGLIAGGLLPF